MLVCLCHGVSESEIVDTVRRGARSADEVGACSGAGTDCGSCLGDLACLIAETRAAMDGEAARRHRQREPELVQLSAGA